LLVVVDGGVSVCIIPLATTAPSRIGWVTVSPSLAAVPSGRHLEKNNYRNPFISSFNFHCQETRHVFFIQFPTHQIIPPSFFYPPTYQSPSVHDL
jgi:hypothetical protein